jgi:MinD superfamily P-loop ATPase
VTEPTLSGIHDMERVIRVAGHFRTQAACCINKFDLNLRMTGQIEEWCEANSVPLVARIPFEEAVTQSLVQGIPVTEFSKNSVSEEIKKMWPRLISLIAKEV